MVRFLLDQIVRYKQSKKSLSYPHSPLPSICLHICPWVNLNMKFYFIFFCPQKINVYFGNQTRYVLTHDMPIVVVELRPKCVRTQSVVYIVAITPIYISFRAISRTYQKVECVQLDRIKEENQVKCLFLYQVKICIYIKTIIYNSLTEKERSSRN